MIVVWLFLVVPWVCLQFVIVVFPDHSHLLCLMLNILKDSEKVSKVDNSLANYVHSLNK